MTNPLLNKDILSHDINFSQIKTKHFKEALDILMKEAKEEFEYLMKQKPTFKVLMQSQDKLSQLYMVYTLLSHYNSTIQTDEIREIYEEYSPKLTEMSQELSMDIRGYNQYIEFVKTEEYQSLDELKKKAVNKSIKDYEKSGIHFPQDKKDELTKLSMKRSELQTQFLNNLTATEAEFELSFTKEELKGVPERVLDGAKKVTIDGVEKYVLSYALGEYDEIMPLCEVENTRKQVYEQLLQKGVIEGKDNRPLMKEIAQLYHQTAQILGYKNSSEVLLEENMVASVEDAMAFIKKLSTASFEGAKKDSEEVKEFGKNLLGVDDIPYHSRSYVIEKMTQQKFQINKEEHRAYFPVSKVVSGLFDLIKNLFEVEFKEDKEKSVWHEDVTCYAVYDMNTNNKLGYLYMDLYKRKFKSTGAWMHPVITRSVKEDKTILPVVYLVCNSQKDAGQESTFEFDDIITIYHEMGHALHNLLTEVDFDYYSGLSNVQHDAVELPSQFMENFCWNYEVLKSMSGHIETGEVFPKEEFDKMLNAKNFLSASTMLGQSKRSEMDMIIYSNKDVEPQEVEKDVNERWKIGKPDPRASLLPQFKHIFCWGYNSGYYAYAWAEVLSADAFAALEEQGATYAEQKEMAQKFRKHIFATGGKDSMDVNFMNFRGREPDVKYLLKSYGVVVE